MTEIGRKRCRKTKLVPRDCTEFVDDDLVLEGPEKKKPLLEKIKEEPRDFIPQESSHQFSVKVEVEDMDESMPDEDPSDYMKYLFSLSKEAQEDPKDLDYADNSLLLEQKLVIPLPEDEKNCIIDVKRTQRMLSSLHRKYPQDKEAVMYTRNLWGKVFAEKIAFDLKRTPQEILIQAALERWKEWAAGRCRESPFCYKCYICNNGWWTLTEFTNHIKNHSCYLQIETRHQECNIVAYGTEGLLHNEVPIHGKCLKCAKTYEHHMANKRDLLTFYYCNYCDERFQTCRTLTKHEGTCPRNPIRILSITKGKDFTCEVCRTVFMSNPDLDEHMIICHKVRSDEPVVTKCKICSACEQRYNNFNFHTCLKKNVNYECKFCSATFHTKQMLEHHMKMWDGVYQCKKCAKFLQRSCMAAEHYALHSEHFRSVIRCLVCKKIKVFTSEDAWRNHKTKYHRRIESRRPSCDKIIMARIMLEQCMVEPVKKSSKVQKPGRTKQNSKLTRGVTIPRKETITDRTHVRVYVPVHSNTSATMGPEKITILHYNTDSKRTEESPGSDLVEVKQEREKCENEAENNEKVLENLIEITEEATNAENSQEVEQLHGEEVENKEMLDNVLLVNSMRTEVSTENVLVQVKKEKETCENEADNNRKVLKKLKEKTKEAFSAANSQEIKKQLDGKEIENKELPDNESNVNSMCMEVSTGNDLVQVKQEKEKCENEANNHKTVLEKLKEKTEKELNVENSQDNEKQVEGKEIENTELLNNESPMNFVETVIKTEKMDEDEITHLEECSIENGKGTKDINNIMAELNEFLDIKPDIIIKEEHLSEDETQLSNIMSSDISKVFQASSTFAEEITDNSEHSKVFRLSKSILESEIKKEVKNEPMDEDPIVLSIDDSAKKSGVNVAHVLNIEPDVILKAGYRKRKIYRCNKCDYSGFHREYKVHVNSHCMKIPKDLSSEQTTHVCTKCAKGFPTLKTYLLHFEQHGYEYISCPQCKVGFENITKLVQHVNVHIRAQFVRVQLLNSTEDTNHCKVYQCKTCKEMVTVEMWFVHWEGHLELSEEPPKKPLETFKVGENGQHALTPNSLKDVLEGLMAQERTKTCIVCRRVFERKNDTKRHLVEHLLEDAYANIVNDTMLECQICHDLLKKPHDYKKHMRDHADLPKYMCGLCNKSFSDSSNFTKHKKIHNTKAFVCDICSKKFQAKFSLEKHIQIHMRTEPMKCEQCPKVFHDRAFFSKHVRLHHNRANTRFRCALCREKFASIRAKWDHMWLVHKQRKEEADCPICGEKYRKFTDVKKHAYDVHGKQITLSNLWSLLGKIKTTGELVAPKASSLKETVAVIKDAPEKDALEKREESSDDDCLLIEEERETLIVYD